MKLWSKGLGKTEVTMDFRHYKTVKDPTGDRVFIYGNMQEPVTWEFRITIEPEDIPGFMKAFFNRCMIKLVFKNLHRYLFYLFNRGKYADPEGMDLEKKVNTTYEQVMTGRRPASLQPQAKQHENSQAGRGKWQTTT